MDEDAADASVGCGGKRRWWIKAPLIASFIAVVILLKSALFAYIWNLLIPELFHGPEITYLQAIGLMILAKLLVGFRGGGGGFGRGGFGGGRFGGKFGSKQGWMMKEIWSRLPDEERQKLREDMRKRWNR